MGVAIFAQRCITASSNATNTKLNKKRRILSKGIQKCVTFACTDVNADFLAMYATYICDHSRACLDNAVFPDLTAQLNIVYNMRAIQDNVDIENFDGLVFKALIINNIDLIKDLLNSISEKNAAQEHIIELAQYLQ